MTVRHPSRSWPRLAARLLVGASLAALLAGCGVTDWFDSEEEGPTLAGNRISVLQLEQTLEPDPALAERVVALPEAAAPADWPQAGATPTNAVGHLPLGQTLKEVWRVGVEGSTDETPVLSGPIVAEGRIYLLDAEFNLHAFDAQTGRPVWNASILREGQDEEAFGGGVAFAGGRLYVTTGYGEAMAVDPANGAVLWRQRIAAPIRSAPIVAGGRVYVLTVANELIVLGADNRVLQWFHTGILESAALLGSSVPAVDNDIVVAPYSSGEIVALRVENGRQVWQENLATVRRGQNLSGLADIRGRPVIDNGLVFAVSHSGRMAAIDLRSGQRAWEQEIGGIETPWVAGDWIFVLTNDNQIVALSRDAGRVRWISQLDQYEDPDDREDPVHWVGPILAGGRLILANSLGELVEVSPASGEVQKRTELPDPVRVAPVVANGTLYVLTDEGDLIAYR